MTHEQRLNLYRIRFTSKQVRRLRKKRNQSFKRAGFTAGYIPPRYWL